MAKANNPILIFDLGNVILEFIGFKEIRKLWMPEVTPEQIRSKWLQSPAMIALERGQISPTNFAEIFVKEWGIKIAPNDFLDLFTSWARPPFTGIHELLEGLNKQYQTACLSNTNAAHWQLFSNEYDIVKYFDHHYASHLMGMVKPDVEIYAAIVDDLNCAPSDLIFFDDTPENIQSARAFGINGHMVNGIGELKAKCSELGLI